MIKLQVEVKNVNYQQGQYAIFSFNLKEKVETPTANLIATGNVGQIYKGEILTIEGEWIDKRQYGLQFRIDKFERTNLASVESIQKFLINIGKEGKIGKRTIEKITDVYGEHSIEMIKKDPDSIMKLKISAKKVNTLRELLFKNADIQKVFDYFKEMGISADTTTELYNAYGIRSIRKSQEDPYSLYEALNFQEMETIAEYTKLPHNFRGRIKSGIIKTILNGMNYSGELFFDTSKDYIFDSVKNFIDKKGYYKNSPKLTEKEIGQVFKELGYSGDIIIPIEYDFDSLFIKKYWYLQKDIADMIEEHIKENQTINDKKIGNREVEEYLKDDEIIYNEGQLSAIRDALNYKISIVTGGPGTGKTQTIKGIMQAFKNKYKEDKIGTPIIQPCAPTGKAAQRIMDLTGTEAMTIHRLLGIRGGSVEDHQIERVYADLIIVDEASMMDSQLFYYLMTAVSSKTHIVLVGDKDQLPSIGRGFILRDLIGVGDWGNKIIGYNKLDRVYRQTEGNPIVQNAYSILNHKEGKQLNIIEREGFKIIPGNNQDDIKEALLGEIERHINDGGSFDELQILTPMNKGELGTLEINKAIQNRFNSRDNTKLEINNSITLKPEDKVIQTVNNYELEVFNGEVGKIVEIEAGPKITVDFGYKEIEYIGEDIKDLILAYAITVHKSQGSEFKKVIMPLCKDHSLMLDKNLLYTAITRSEDNMIFIGNKDILKISAEKKKETSDNNLLNKIMKRKKGLI